MELNPDKGQPVLREWELNENSTRFEQNFAAPSDQGLVPYWSLWTLFSLGGGLFVFTVFLGVASSKKTRSQPFNLYILFLMVPDFTMEILCGITCLLSAVKGSYWSHWMCNFQSFYLIWSIGSNCWLNAIITYQIHDLLKCSFVRRRYKAPPLRSVILHAIAVYLYVGFLASWGLFNSASRWPHRSFLSKGLACLPAEYNRASAFFFWLFFMPLFAVIPVGYVIYVAWDMKRSNLLPPSGRRRVLAVYFGRIIVVFLALWGPCILFNFLLAPWMPLWMTWLAGTFGHLQGPVSAGLSLMKDDIRLAVIRFLKCKSSEKYDHEFEPVLDDGNYSSSCQRSTSANTQKNFESMRIPAGSSRPIAANSYSGRATSREEDYSRELDIHVEDNGDDSDDESFATDDDDGIIKDLEQAHMNDQTIREDSTLRSSGVNSGEGNSEANADAETTTEASKDIENGNSRPSDRNLSHELPSRVSNSERSTIHRIDLTGTVLKC